MESRRNATKVLTKLWTRISELEREYYLSQGERTDLKFQLDNMRKQCIEIMDNVKRKEVSHGS